MCKAHTKDFDEEFKLISGRVWNSDCKCFGVILGLSFEIWRECKTCVLKSLKNSCGENTGGENVLCFEMAVFKDRQRMLYVMQLLITQLVVCLGWLSHITLAQLEISEKVTGSGSFPDLVITCITNLSVFITCFLGRRLDLDISARDVVAPGPKLEDINGFGVSICKGEYQNASVVMLSNCTPTSSMRHFMKYLFNAHDLYSIVLQCNRLEYAVVPVQTCKCSEHGVRVRCNCIVFSTVKDITIILANRMPGILKRLSDSLCLLPSLKCLKNGCHGCKEDLNPQLLYVKHSIFFRISLPQVRLTASAFQCIQQTTTSGQSCWSDL